jgi:ribose/xylose/arabinose/galactoside ABC-type transport system permease subunit
MNNAFDQWLAKVLAELPRSVHRRIIRELTAHYSEARQAYQNAGDSPEVAARRALADLGNPAATARAFAAVYRPPVSYRVSLAVLLLAGLALLAWYALSRISGANTADLGLPTAYALIVQVAVLTMALSIPLLFDDLDLSTGVVVMLGALVAYGAATHTFSYPAVPLQLVPALILAVVVGAGFGLLNGVLAVLTRRPVFLISLMTGGSLAIVLAFFPRIHNLALASPERLVVLEPTLIVLGIAGLALLGMLWISLRRGYNALQPSVIPSQPSERGWLLASLSLIFIPMVGAMGLINVTIGGTAFIWLTLAFLAIGFLLGWWIVPRPTDSATLRQRRRQHQLWLCIGMPVVLLIVIGALAAWRDPAFFGDVELFSKVLLGVALVGFLGIVALACVILFWSVYAGPAYAWLTPARVQHQLPRIAALMLSSALAAVVGVFTSVQGIRDNTYVLATSFYVLVPLAGLLVGGQHVLRGKLRPVGALLGGLVVATLCTPLGSDNLSPGALGAVLLAAVVSLVWRVIAGNDALPAAFDSQLPPAEDDVQEEGLRLFWRDRLTYK